jgi:hypothetical protein
MTDHLILVAAAAFTAGARADLHNLGGLHADAHHATLTLDVLTRRGIGQTPPAF